jgi:hypothetical protein
LKKLVNHIKKLGFVQLGVIFEKMVPLIISFVFISEIEVEVYGRFVVHYQAIIIAVGALSASVIQDFNNNYLTSSDNIEIKDPYTGLVLGFLILFIGWLIDVVQTEYLLRVIAIAIVAPINLIIFNFQRFKNKEHLYFSYALLRVGIFLLALFLFLEENLSLAELLDSILILNALPILFYFKRIKIKWSGVILKRENFLVSIYGLTTLFLFGAEKMFMEIAGYNLEEIAAISYSLTIINSSTILIEGAKKQIGPNIYYDLQNDGVYSNRLLKSLKNYFVFLTCCIVLTPLILTPTLMALNLFQSNLSLGNYSFSVLIINQIIFSIYHFINPYLFFWKKTIVLIIIQLTSIIFFFLAINLIPKHLLNIAFIKLGTSILLISCVAIYIKNKDGRIF